MAYASFSYSPLIRGEKRILGASQDLEHSVFRMRKVYSFCKKHCPPPLLRGGAESARQSGGRGRRDVINGINLCDS